MNFCVFEPDGVFLERGACYRIPKIWEKLFFSIAILNPRTHPANQNLTFHTPPWHPLQEGN